MLSHEMAHAYRGHMAYLRAKQALGLALAIPAAIFGGQAAGQLAMVLVEAASKKFDRDQEREADIYGLIAVYKAGFDPSLEFVLYPSLIATCAVTTLLVTGGNTVRGRGF